MEFEFSIDKFFKEHGDIKTVGIAGHLSPDGDSIGSCLGLYLYLKKNYPGLKLDIFAESVPEELKLIKDSSEVNTQFASEVDVYDAFFILDTEKERSGGAEEFFDKAKLSVNIDHHISNTGSGMINILDPKASSACEIVASVLDTEKMDIEVAKALYIGMVTDTGIFHYSNTSPKTMRIAASLMEFGFDHSSIIEHVELEKSFSQNRGLGEALAAARLELGGKLVISSMSYEEILNKGLSSDDFGGAVSQMNLTIGAECSIFIKGTKDKKVKISLRSKEKVNVAEAAKALGGGGHMRAAGIITDRPIDEVIDILTKKVREQLESC